MSKNKKQIQLQAQAMISASDAGLFATTVKLASEFLDKNPGSVRGWLDSGDALACLHRYEDAIAAYEKALELVGAAGQSPDGIYAALGQLERQRGDFPAADAQFQNRSIAIRTIQPAIFAKLHWNFSKAMLSNRLRPCSVR